MSGKPLRPCRYPGCFCLTATGWCPEHQPKAKRPDRRSDEAREWHKLYRTKRWKSMRYAQLLNEPFCRECAKRGERVRATDVDHIRPHRGDPALFYDTGNLQSLCHRCHSAKTRKEMREFSRKRLR
ncbi:HNH endonuclease signature motif containing protein [Vermiculatibacterium agrestimuris]|uniref:HNH endonuclease signature motif containing protein n=1 Tax=Vermiculatibacterium agrestimuris TaxID=2941519 RepID=UPI0030BA0B19